MNIFTKSLKTCLPEGQKLINHLTNKHNIILNYPIELFEVKPQRVAMRLMTNVRRNNKLLLLSASEGFFSTNFIGTSVHQNQKLNTILNELNGKYDILNKEFTDKLKILMQIFANSAQLQGGKEMPLKQFSNYILNQKKYLKMLPKQEINSRYMLAIYDNNIAALKQVHQILQETFLRALSLEKFIEIYSKMNPLIKQHEGIKVVAPFLDNIEHSFDPNCQIQGLYLTHRRQSMLAISTLRNITEGQKLTLNYGNVGNQQMLIKFGFIVKDNPYRCAYLPINYIEAGQQFMKNSTLKQNMLGYADLRLKSTISINARGQIAQKDLQMLRIVLDDSQEPFNESNYPVIDKNVYSFVKKQAKRIINMIKVNNMRQTTNPDMKQIELEEEDILKKLINNSLG